MSQEFESDLDDIGCTRSGKKYKVDFKYSIFGNSSDNARQQIHSNTKRIEGCIPYHPYTPQKTTGTQNNPIGTPSSSSPTTHTTATSPTSTPPSGSNIANQHPPHRNRMGDDIEIETEDPEQHWFLCEAVWTIKWIHDDNIKLVQLVTTLRERALTWYMKYTSTIPRTLV